MKKAMIALSAAALMVTAPVAFAQGVSSKTPGQEMQAKGSKAGEPGASSHTPGHKKMAKHSKKSHPGASSYAPGQTTGMSTTKQR